MSILYRIQITLVYIRTVGTMAIFTIHFWLLLAHLKRVFCPLLPFLLFSGLPFDKQTVKFDDVQPLFRMSLDCVAMIHFRVDYYIEILRIWFNSSRIPKNGRKWRKGETRTKANCNSGEIKRWTSCCQYIVKLLLFQVN